ncbi:hypothetical protein C8R43DRAFT_1242472 [Mycena crocata]|nr:hypothetical protein C8R43DRAFT_1242472 [Mycena crocata]
MTIVPAPRISWIITAPLHALVPLNHLSAHSLPIARSLVPRNILAVDVCRPNLKSTWAPRRHPLLPPVPAAGERGGAYVCECTRFCFERRVNKHQRDFGLRYPKYEGGKRRILIQTRLHYTTPAKPKRRLSALPSSPSMRPLFETLSVDGGPPPQTVPRRACCPECVNGAGAWASMEHGVRRPKNTETRAVGRAYHAGRASRLVSLTPPAARTRYPGRQVQWRAGQPLFRTAQAGRFLNSSSQLGSPAAGSTTFPQHAFSVHWVGWGWAGGGE